MSISGDCLKARDCKVKARMQLDFCLYYGGGGASLNSSNPSPIGSCLEVMLEKIDSRAEPSGNFAGILQGARQHSLRAIDCRAVITCHHSCWHCTKRKRHGRSVPPVVSPQRSKPLTL